jgi:hypothetical protein
MDTSSEEHADATQEKDQAGARYTFLVQDAYRAAYEEPSVSLAAEEEEGQRRGWDPSRLAATLYA